MALTRRDLIRTGIAGGAGLLLAGRLGPRGWAAAPAAKAKAVIQIWMWGGPCHIDTFDPKPAAGSDYTGPLDKPIPTNVDGLQVGELLPLLATQADKYSVIRSMTHSSNAHESASYWVQTGRKPGDRLVYPGVGSIVSLFRGYNAGYKGLIPPYVVLTGLQGRFSESGFLGPRFAPFATGGDPQQTPFAVQGVITPGVTEQRQRDRRELLHTLNTFGNALKGNSSLDAFTQSEDQAYELILGDAGKVFDLSQENAEMRERYGRNTFGQSCLAARRLVERGVPYVTINFMGWDTHKQHFQTMRQGDVDAAAGSVGARPARQHHHLVGRRIRQNSQSAVGSAVEWRARPLGTSVLGRACRRRIQGRTRDRIDRCAGRGGQGSARVSGRRDCEHLRATRPRPEREAAEPGWARYPPCADGR